MEIRTEAEGKRGDEDRDQSGPAYLTFTPKTEEEMAADDARFYGLSDVGRQAVAYGLAMKNLDAEILLAAENLEGLRTKKREIHTAWVTGCRVEEDVLSDFALKSILRTKVGVWVRAIYMSAVIDHRTGGGPFYRDSQNIPPDIKASIDAHVMSGKPTGSFLEAVLKNDLKTAVMKADESNYLLLGAIVGYCCNELPVVCWGSEDAVANWRRKGGWLAVYPGEPLRMKGLVTP